MAAVEWRCTTCGNVEFNNDPCYTEPCKECFNTSWTPFYDEEYAPYDCEDYRAEAALYE